MSSLGSGTRHCRLFPVSRGTVFTNPKRLPECQKREQQGRAIASNAKPDRGGWQPEFDETKGPIRTNRWSWRKSELESSRTVAPSLFAGSKSAKKAFKSLERIDWSPILPFPRDGILPLSAGNSLSAKPEFATGHKTACFAPLPQAARFVSCETIAPYAYPASVPHETRRLPD